MEFVYVVKRRELFDLHQPQGFLDVAAHRDEIEGLLRNVEEREKSEHPLKRIMSIRPDGDAVVVRVTDAKLVTQLGHAVDRAYNGALELPPSTAEQSELARGRWRRD